MEKETVLKLAAELVGVIVIVLSLLSFQCKKRKNIMLAQMSASLLSSVSLLLAGAVPGACLDFICFLRTLIFSNNGKKWASSRIWLYAFIAIMIASGIVTWENSLSIFPILGGVLSTVAFWMKKEKHIRLISLCVGPCWIIYNIFDGTLAGALNEVLAMSSIIIGLLRHDRKKNINQQERV